MISTREFVIDDHKEAVALWRLLDGIEVAEGDSENEIANYLSRNPGLSRVAEENGKMVGAVLCGHDGRRGLIYHLGVLPDYQGKGIGRLLVGECVELLRKAGMTRALILVAQSNPDAHAFWLRNGWEDVPEVTVMGLDL